MKVLLSVFLIVSCALANAKKKPNIVVLFVDDYGWADVGYRNSDFVTPNINKLSEEAMDFSRAYVASPACSPSRASLLTGKEAIRMEMSRHIKHEDEYGRNSKKYNYWPGDETNRNSINWLPLEEVTYAERLKEFDYFNVFLGKWHLGHEPYHPIHQGFDVQFGTSNWGHPKGYYPPFMKPDIPEELKGFGSEDYLTDVLADKAVDFIVDYDKNQPFMMSLWYYNVHSPHTGRKDLIQHYKDLGWEERYANYGAMVSAMDESVGRVRKALEEKGIADNTVILFTSDQGGFFTNYPLKGKKNGGNTLGEGGMRVPFILLYPGKTKAGSKCEIPIQNIDVYPTLVEIASNKKCSDTNIQGKSILPLVNGGDFPERDLFFYRAYEDQYEAIISGDWKLINYHKGQPELYNLKDDLSEVSNLYYVRPSKVKELKKKLATWEAEAVPQIIEENK